MEAFPALLTEGQLGGLSRWDEPKEILSGYQRRGFWFPVPIALLSSLAQHQSQALLQPGPAQALLTARTCPPAQALPTTRTWPGSHKASPALPQTAGTPVLCRLHKTWLLYSSCQGRVFWVPGVEEHSKTLWVYWEHSLFTPLP